MQKTRQTSLVATTIPRDEPMQADSSLRMKMYGKNVLWWLRFYISKIKYEPTIIVQSDLDSCAYLINKFFYEESLGLQQRISQLNSHSLNVLLRLLDFSQKKNLEDYFKNSSLQKYLEQGLTAHSYFGIKFQNPRMKLPKLYIQRRTKRTHSIKHVGVGYNDKGTARLPALDGSPPWQEVAMCFENHEKGRYINVTKLEKSRIPKFKSVTVNGGPLGTEVKKFSIERVQTEFGSESWKLNTNPAFVLAGFEDREPSFIELINLQTKLSSQIGIYRSELIFLT